MFEKLKNYHSANYITREQLQSLAGGIVSAKTIANLDSRGLGIKDRKLVGKKIAYHIDDVIQWLKQNTKRIK
jgi:phage terminase Nu1 subunit (DNA packaging protein)